MVSEAEIENLRKQLELKLPRIFCILAEAIEESSASGNFRVEIKLRPIDLLKQNDSSQEGTDQTSLSDGKPSVLSIAIEDQQVLLAGSTYYNPCPDPDVYPAPCMR